MRVFDELTRAIDDCTSVPWDATRRTTRDRFERFFTHHEPLLRCAIAAGIAARREAAGARIASERAHFVLDELRGGLGDGLSSIGYDVGYFHGGQPWDELCLVRSAIVFLEKLTLAHDPEMGAETRGIMDVHAHEMFETVDVPEGMPESHWWWRAAFPPAT